MSRFAYAGLLVLLILLIAGCGTLATPPAAEVAQAVTPTTGVTHAVTPTTVHVTMPDFVLNAFSDAQEAYRFAVEDVQQHPMHPELRNYPCYCGCVYLGHKDNFDCYIKEVDAAGNITFDSHATGCGTCVWITLDVKRLKAEGWSSLEIRTYIDDTYGKYGPPTDTPLPAA